MIPERLFELAFLYKKARLWKRLWDSQIFGVRFSDGEIGYCCVMGMMGELNAIAVYPGQSGLDSLRILHDAPAPEDELASMEKIHSEDCLMLSFNNKSRLNARDLEDVAAYCRRNGIDYPLRGKNAYPQFERFRPGYVRWFMEDEADQRRMIEALEAAIAVSDRLALEMKTPEMLGLFEGAPYDREIPLLTRADAAYRWEAFPLPPRAPVEWPPIVIDDELSLARLQKAPRKGEWAIRLFRFVNPLTDSSQEDVSFDELTKPPFYPWAMLIVEIKTGFVLSSVLCDDPEDYTQFFGMKLTEAVANFGMPKRIVVLDDCTEQAMRRFCDQFGVRLERKKRCKALTEALNSLLAHMTAEEEDDGPDDLLGETMEMLRQPDVVAALPDEFLKMIFTATKPSDFPEDVYDMLHKEGIRRGLLRK
ncbi:MAG: hypothetical protein IJH86_11505 [Clostridia bacterium]|nr:hypothetical protein [Clostridia bacterium]